MANLRREYTLTSLSESDLDPDPFVQFEKWFQLAVESGGDLANAMTLATATKDGAPSARIVLLKDFDEQGFVFFTNYGSQKGRELAENPNAALVFHWAELERQVCITGQVSKVSRKESESYFQSRPVGARLGAWVSRQSQVILSREVLENRFEQLVADYPDEEIPMPPYWGGMCLKPDTIEFWQGRPNRLNDRLRYTRRPNNGWLIERLSP